jgi:D-beta-D-heptose 7-phosphate kinase/D-beta-D-heptose 1-phosphate adenosyltransferase
MITVAVSGGFDPVHIGHVRLFKAARALGDRLIVIVNNDYWLMQKKGYVFMPEQERCEIIRSFRAVDCVHITDHSSESPDNSVCSELWHIRPDIFANGGDRGADNMPEYSRCRALGISMVFNVGAGGKVQSSSQLAQRVVTAHMVGLKNAKD